MESSQISVEIVELPLENPTLESPAKDDTSDNNEVVRCSSIASLQCTQRPFRRQSSLLKVKTKSRIMDHTVGNFVEEEEEQDQLVEKDELVKEDLERKSLWVLFQWVGFVLITTAFICSLSLPSFRKKNLWKLELWRWEILVLVVISGRLISGWIIRIIVFFIEMNFPLRKRVFYFVYALRNIVQNSLWMVLILIVWQYLFDKNVAKETDSNALRFVTKVLVCVVMSLVFWLAKTLLVMVLPSSFHKSTDFDRILDSLFNQYVIEALSGPPKNKKIDEEGKGIGGSGKMRKSPQDKTNTPFCLASRKGHKKSWHMSIDELHQMNPKNISAWNMKELLNIIQHGPFSTLDKQIEDSKSTKIKTENEVENAAKRIFENVAKPGIGYIDLEDIERFMGEDEARKTMRLFEKGSESKRISKLAVENWVVNAFWEWRVLSLTLNDTETAVKRLHHVVNVLVIIIIAAISLLIIGITTERVFLMVSTHVLSLAFKFGDTLIFIFVTRPYDVGDRCQIDGVQMVVEEIGILNTIFLGHDNGKIIIPNSVLARKPICNFYSSPDMGDEIEFCVHIATPVEKIDMMEQKILR
ncbi:hypothetical protein SLEP1_g2880 [Rubroshorea leprosula]|uniref:Mechanosensitive ion channel MscS domain-containing protein n=1 Tax=Rubroshorea leprosula TaxID=152421 RepID=A0AAV5HIL8_9ROSI|nr:hypothetical protein SLEP1_g2880 [Rubroshorea leprosula]